MLVFTVFTVVCWAAGGLGIEGNQSINILGRRQCYVCRIGVEDFGKHKISYNETHQ